MNGDRSIYKTLKNLQPKKERKERGKDWPSSNNMLAPLVYYHGVLIIKHAPSRSGY
jgi:hypothetical protein